MVEQVKNGSLSLVVALISVFTLSGGAVANTPKYIDCFSDGTRKQAQEACDQSASSQSGFEAAAIAKSGVCLSPNSISFSGLTNQYLCDFIENSGHSCTELSSEPSSAGSLWHCFGLGSE